MRTAFPRNLTHRWTGCSACWNSPSAVCRAWRTEPEPYSCLLDTQSSRWTSAHDKTWTCDGWLLKLYLKRRYFSPACVTAIAFPWASSQEVYGAVITCWHLRPAQVLPQIAKLWLLTNVLSSLFGWKLCNWCQFIFYGSTFMSFFPFCFS